MSNLTATDFHAFSFRRRSEGECPKSPFPKSLPRRRESIFNRVMDACLRRHDLVASFFEDPVRNDDTGLSALSNICVSSAQISGFLFLFLQPAHHIFGKIGQNHIGAGAFDGGQQLHRDFFLVDPAELRRGFDHGKFAADIVGGYR